MKKIAVLIILLLMAGMTSFAQKKNGTVYSEHDAIETSRALWKATVEGDVSKFQSFFADSAMITTNGERSEILPNSELGKGLDQWAGSYDKLTIQDQKPAYPDAIEYKDGGTWVQDWLLLTGTHKETGINLNLPVHCLYAFDEDGKIAFMVRYFDNDVFEEIQASKGKKVNGKVYINHPYIVHTRKAMNAFVAKDAEAMRSFYNPNARFSTSVSDLGDSWSLDENMDFMKKKFFREGLKYKTEQVGYPDCIYYEKSQQYVVYSWWKMTVKTDDLVYEFPYMLSQDYDEEGMIVREHIYVSSNHSDKF